jgi:hypothetical protein
VGKNASAGCQVRFKRALVPAANMPEKGDAGIDLLPVRRLTEALSC